MTDRILRILHVNDRLSQRGGADWHLWGVLTELAKYHRVELVVSKVDGTIPSPCPLTVLPGLDSRRSRPVDLQPLADRMQPDLIHLHNIINPWVLQWASRRPALMTIQDHRVFCPFRGKWTAQGEVCSSPMSRDICAGCFEDDSYFEQVFTLTSRRLEVVRQLPLTVLSHYMKRELMAVGVPEESISVIPPFVHGLEPSAEPDGPPCVLWLGRLVDTKGVQDAITAWHLCGIELPMVVAGTGSRRSQLEQHHPDVEFLGWVPHSRLSALYRRARAVLVTSRWQEPFGIVGLEALTLGTPVVAWESGGVAQWYPPGYPLVEWGDVEGLARSLRHQVGRPMPAPRGFERDRLMANLQEVYSRVLASSSR